MKNILFKIPAIHCNHCSHTIKMELSELEGVGSVQVDVAKKEVAITFEPPASEQKIRELLIEINYPTEV